MPGTSQSMHAPPGQQEGNGHHQERNEWAGYRFDPYTGRPMGNPGGGDPGPGDGGGRGGGGGGAIGEDEAPTADTSVVVERDKAGRAAKGGGGGGGGGGGAGR